MRALGFLLSVFAAACGGGGGGGGGPDAPPTPEPGKDAPTPDAAPSFGLTAIFPAAASRVVSTDLSITGFGISGTPTIHLSNCDQPGTAYDIPAGAVTGSSIAMTLAADPTRVQGAYTVTVTNGDGLTASLPCALRIVTDPPPRVTQIVPSTAWQGLPGDGISSDVTVGIQGAGFSSTPNVRWVLRTDPSISFDAVFVGFVSDTHLTATVPSETATMPVGSYDVFVTNPDQLTAQWKIGSDPGTFTITGTPPPDVVAVSPARIQNGVCTSTSLTISGSNFGVGATAWYVAPAGTACTGSTTDANGNLLCPITVDTVTSTAITAHLSTCPALGPYPVVVINPDNQSDYWFSIEVTPSSDGHLNTGSWEILQSRLETPRWKHAAQYGFDVFSDALMYVAGGQDATNQVIGSVERSQFDLFGVPGPFHHLEQYGGAGSPRVANDLNVARGGSTLVRAGSTLFSIGGTTSRSDTTTIVAASKVVERAEILGFSQMPGLKQPVALTGTTGLPSGAWYYRVSAIGPWGESLATREVVAIGKSGQIQVCWQAPSAPGAVSYNLYRSLASDGRAGTSAAIAYEVTAVDNCWIDTGTERSAPAPGNTRGTLAQGGTQTAGTYTYRVSAVVPLAAGGTWETYAGYASSTSVSADDVTAGNRTVNVAWDAVPITGVTYRVYRLDPATGGYKLVPGADALTATSFADTGIAFAGNDPAPVPEIMPLPPGSLSKWDAMSTPQLGTAREGLDGVVVALDPTASGGLVARIIVAGGRDGSSGSYVYHSSAESLGIHADGTTDAAWALEGPGFTHPRGYYALLTTQDRNVTPFPPPPAQPPCTDCGVIIQRSLSTAIAQFVQAATAPSAAVLGGEPVYLVAVMGDDAFVATNNGGRADFESCPVDMATGHLVSDCGIPSGTTWVVQNNNEPQPTFGLDAVLYFSFLYPFGAVQRETVGAAATSLQIMVSAIGRFPLVSDLTAVTATQILDTFQSASTSFAVHRAYYQMARLLAYVYVIGGFAESHSENGVTVPAGPTALVERHQQ
ncbi:MAG TPA: IPT/TIG domain-containing protein [Kofleriaceae bacterium]|nr:IPT/TIG domain-containing protein [Kofleriaceae bacterium]